VVGIIYVVIRLVVMVTDMRMSIGKVGTNIHWSIDSVSIDTMDQLGSIECVEGLRIRLCHLICQVIPS